MVALRRYASLEVCGLPNRLDGGDDLRMVTNTGTAPLCLQDDGRVVDFQTRSR